MQEVGEQGGQEHLEEAKEAVLGIEGAGLPNRGPRGETWLPPSSPSSCPPHPILQAQPDRNVADVAIVICISYSFSLVLNSA